MFTFLDLATHCKYAEPVDTNDTSDVVLAMQYVIVGDFVRCVRSRNWRATKQACEIMNIVRESSTPDIH
jgi:hypothetical protein